MTPFDSSALAAKEVSRIISRNTLLSTVIFLFSDTVPMSGNSSAGMPTIRNSLSEVRIETLLCSPRVISTSSDGSFLIISVKSFAGRTIDPGSDTITPIFFSMLRSMSEAVIVSVPLSSAARRIPFSIGMVLLAVTALETKVSALFNSC